MTEPLRKRFSLDAACLALLAALGVQLLFQFVLILFPLSEPVLNWTAVISNQIIFFGVSLLWAKKKRVDFLAVLGVKRPPKAYLFPLFALISLCCVACFGPLSALFSRWLSHLGYTYQSNYFVPMKNAGLFTLAFLALTILPAIGEETAIRGVILSGGKNKSPLFAIFYSALIFALMHGNLRQLVHQFLLGSVMGYLAYLTGGIYASATVHLVNNAAALLLDYGEAHAWFGSSFYGYFVANVSIGKILVGVTVSLVLLLGLLVLVTLLVRRERGVRETEPSTQGGFFTRINESLRRLSAEDGDIVPLDRTAILVSIVLAGVLALLVVLNVLSEVIV